MVTVIRKQIREQDVVGGNDKVMAFMPIPPGGRLNGISGEVSIQVGNIDSGYWNGSKQVYQAFMFPAAVYAVQVQETGDITGGIDDLWDKFIPKDVEMTETENTYWLDLDHDTSAVTRPREEPGEMSPNEIFGVNEPSRLLWQREEMITFAKNGRGYESPSADHNGPDYYQPTEYYRVNARSGISFPQGGFVAFGVSAPTWDNTTNAIGTGIADIQSLLQFQHMRLMLELAMPALLGLTETGATDPFGTVLTLIEDLAEPTITQTAATGANPTTFYPADAKITTNFRISVSVGDDQIPNTIGG